MVFLEDVAKGVGLEYFFDAKKAKGHLKGKRTQRRVEFSLNDDKVKGFWGQSTLSKAPLLLNGKVAVPVDFADKALRPLLSGHSPIPPPAPRSLFQVDVVIDPGHGGNDWGANLKVDDDIVKEKDLSLFAAQTLCQLLKQKRVNCLLTRNDDIYLTLHERTQFANHAGAKLFLSLHLNSEPKKKEVAKGYELYVLSLSKEPSARLAVARENQSIPEDLPEGVEKAVADLKAESLFEDSLRWAKTVSASLAPLNSSFGKAIKAGPFYVLYGANMPSVLLELGFITHPEERLRLRSPTTRAQYLGPLSERIAAELKK